MNPVPPHLTRRQALLLGGAASLPVLSRASAKGEVQSIPVRPGFSLNAGKLRIFHPALKKRVRALVIADTHSARDDSRGGPFQKYSSRMAKAYQNNRHFSTGEIITSEVAFERVVARAVDIKADLLLLAGDILSFPSEAGVEWMLEVLEKSGLPYLFTAGNHDWHYEGTKGTLAELRDEWIRKRLLPLYQGADPLAYAREAGGIRFLAIDNSTYEILPAQLEFFRREAARCQPMVLMMHIPLYMPGRSTGFGCGHPEWNAKTDRNHRIERRPPWPETGHTDITFSFHREVMENPHLLAIFAGHLHAAHLDVHGNAPQFVAEANFRGGALEASFEPPRAPRG